MVLSKIKIVFCAYTCTGVPLCLLCPRFQAPVPESCVDWKRHVPPSRALDPALSPSPVRAGPGVGPPGPRSLRSRLLPDRAGGTRRSCRPGRVTGVAEHRVSWAENSRHEHSIDKETDSNQKRVIKILASQVHSLTLSVS